MNNKKIKDLSLNYMKERTNYNKNIKNTNKVNDKEISKAATKQITNKRKKPLTGNTFQTSLDVYSLMKQNNEDKLINVDEIGEKVNLSIKNNHFNINNKSKSINQILANKLNNNALFSKSKSSSLDSKNQITHNTSNINTNSNNDIEEVVDISINDINNNNNIISLKNKFKNKTHSQKSAKSNDPYVRFKNVELPLIIEAPLLLNKEKHKNIWSINKILEKHQSSPEQNYYLLNYDNELNIYIKDDSLGKLSQEIETMIFKLLFIENRYFIMFLFEKKSFKIVIIIYSIPSFFNYKQINLNMNDKKDIEGDKELSMTQRFYSLVKLNPLDIYVNKLNLKVSKEEVNSLLSLEDKSFSSVSVSVEMYNSIGNKDSSNDSNLILSSFFKELFSVNNQTNVNNNNNNSNRINKETVNTSNLEEEETILDNLAVKSNLVDSNKLSFIVSMYKEKLPLCDFLLQNNLLDLLYYFDYNKTSIEVLHNSWKYLKIDFILISKKYRDEYNKKHDAQLNSLNIEEHICDLLCKKGILRKLNIKEVLLSRFQLITEKKKDQLSTNKKRINDSKNKENKENNNINENTYHGVIDAYNNTEKVDMPVNHYFNKNKNELKNKENNNNANKTNEALKEIKEKDLLTKQLQNYLLTFLLSIHAKDLYQINSKIKKLYKTTNNIKETSLINYDTLPNDNFFYQIERIFSTNVYQDKQSYELASYLSIYTTAVVKQQIKDVDKKLEMSLTIIKHIYWYFKSNSTNNLIMFINNNKTEEELLEQFNNSLNKKVRSVVEAFSDSEGAFLRFSSDFVFEVCCLSKIVSCFGIFRKFDYVINRINENSINIAYKNYLYELIEIANKHDNVGFNNQIKNIDIIEKEIDVINNNIIHGKKESDVLNTYETDNNAYYNKKDFDLKNLNENNGNLENKEENCKSTNIQNIINQLHYYKLESKSFYKTISTAIVKDLFKLYLSVYYNQNHSSDSIINNEFNISFDLKTKFNILLETKSGINKLTKDSYSNLDTKLNSTLVLYNDLILEKTVMFVLKKLNLNSNLINSDILLEDEINIQLKSLQIINLKINYSNDNYGIRSINNEDFFLKQLSHSCFNSEYYLSEIIYRLILHINAKPKIKVLLLLIILNKGAYYTSYRNGFFWLKLIQIALYEIKDFSIGFIVIKKALEDEFIYFGAKIKLFNVCLRMKEKLIDYLKEDSFLKINPFSCYYIEELIHKHKKSKDKNKNIISNTDDLGIDDNEDDYRTLYTIGIAGLFNEILSVNLKSLRNNNKKIDDFNFNQNRKDTNTAVTNILPQVSQEDKLFRILHHKTDSFYNVVLGRRQYDQRLLVEKVAIDYYKKNFNYKGIHGENLILPCLLEIFFYDIIHKAKVVKEGRTSDTNDSNYYLHPFQTLPFDFFTFNFYSRNIEKIQKRTKEVQELSLTSLLNKINSFYNDFTPHAAFVKKESVIHNRQLITYISLAFGSKALGRLLDTFIKKPCLKGFPDLFLWPNDTKYSNIYEKIIICEVKSENDKLSEEQIWWLGNLVNCGIKVDVLKVGS